MSLNRFSSLILPERCARDPLDTLSMLKVRDLLSIYPSAGPDFTAHFYHFQTRV